MYYTANAKYCGFVCFGYEVTSRFCVGIYMYVFFVYTYVTYSSYGLTTTKRKTVHNATFTNKIIKHYYN